MFAVVALALATATGPVLGADPPPCPSDWPAQGYAGELREADYGQNLFEGFHTDGDGARWYVFRSGNSNGSTTVRAYPESDDYPTGYVSDQPHQVCYLIVRDAGGTEDLDPPRQITFSKDSDDGSNSGSGTGSSQSTTRNTENSPTPENGGGSAETTQQTSETISLSSDTGTPGIATVGLTWFAIYGTEVPITITLSGLESDADSTTVDYHFRARVKQGTTIDLLCQGAGMNTIRELTTNTGSSTQTITIPGTCPVGTYTIEVELGAGDDTDLSDPIAEGTGFLVIGEPLRSEQSIQTSSNGNGGNNGGGGGGNGNGNGGNNGGGGNGGGGNGNGGNGNGGNGNGNNGNTVTTVSDCGDAGRGSTGTPGTPGVPTLALMEDTTMVGVRWIAPADNGQTILGYSIMVTPSGGIAAQHDAGGLSEIISGLSADTTYEFNVSACNSVGFGPWSPGKLLITATTPSMTGGNTIGDTNNWCGTAAVGSTGTPDAPDAPTVTGATDITITVTWTAPANDGGSQIKMYAVQWTPAGGTAEMEKVMSATTFTHTISNVASGTGHLVQVAACNVVGMSPWSSAANALTTGTRQNPQPTEEPDQGSTSKNDPNTDDGATDKNDPNANDDNGGGNSDDPNDFRPIVIGRCTTAGEWEGHTHQNDTVYWGGTVGCLTESLIDNIDDVDTNTEGAQHGRMWTKDRLSDHKHYSQDIDGNWVIVSDIYDHDGDNNPDNTSCSVFHAAAHSGHTVKPGCRQP